VILNRDRSRHVRWLDAAGQDDAQQPPQDGRWRVEGGTLLVDTRRPRIVSMLGGTGPPGHEWSFEVAEGRWFTARRVAHPLCSAVPRMSPVSDRNAVRTASEATAAGRHPNDQRMVSCEALHKG
jgi:hypothetical protein